MRLKIFTLVSILVLAFMRPTAVSGVTPGSTDTIYNPTILYTSMPRSYEIAGIEIEGAPNYDDYTILGVAGIKVGDRISLPGDDVTNAVKRLMRQALFSQARVEVVKTVGDKAWLKLVLRTQPRISSVNYIGVSF